MPTSADGYFAQDAVRDLCATGLHVEHRVYGFHLSHEDSAGTYDGECGLEHDGSISLSVRVNMPPVRWFFRYSAREMAEFIGSAYTKVRQGQFETLAAALEDADNNYDHEELSRRLGSLDR